MNQRLAISRATAAPAGAGQILRIDVPWRHAESLFGDVITTVTLGGASMPGFVNERGRKQHQ